MTLSAGDDETCTITNDDIAPETVTNNVIALGTVSPVPGLPAAGFPPQEKNTVLSIIILSSISLLSIFLYFARKKQAT